MQQKKMIEKAIFKMEKQMCKLESYLMLLESRHMSYEHLFDTIISAKKAIEELNKEANIGDIEDVITDLEEMRGINLEKQEYFAVLANENKEDLLAELDELEADALANKLEDLAPVPVQIIK